MQLTKQQILILRGKICPYCSGKTQIVTGDEIYGKNNYDFKLFWICRPCAAWVGCHAGTRTALGRLANMELRTAKKKAHFYFDQVWQNKNIMHRADAYVWLSKMLDIPKEWTHVGCFDVRTCERVVNLSRVLLSNKSLINSH